MSGHSHSKTIKHAKELTDKKRGQMFSKMARVISVAAKEGGPNPDTNSKLRLAFETAKKINMPKENIERAVKRGTGELEEEKLEEVIYEAYGPGNTAIIIEVITDNKNRSLAEIKQILNQHGGKLANEGSVRWMFERKGVITLRITLDPLLQRKGGLPVKVDLDELRIKNKEELELIAIEAGAEDIYWHDDILDVYTKPEELEKVKENLEKQGIKIESAGLDWVAKNMVQATEKEEQTLEKLFEALDENDAIQEIYSNLK